MVSESVSTGRGLRIPPGPAPGLRRCCLALRLAAGASRCMPLDPLQSVGGRWPGSSHGVQAAHPGRGRWCSRTRLPVWRSRRPSGSCRSQVLADAHDDGQVHDHRYFLKPLGPYWPPANFAAILNREQGGSVLNAHHAGLDHSELNRGKLLWPENFKSQRSATP